jgi:hypothetical protein
MTKVSDSYDNNIKKINELISDENIQKERDLLLNKHLTEYNEICKNSNKYDSELNTIKKEYDK